MRMMDNKYVFFPVMGPGKARDVVAAIVNYREMPMVRQAKSASLALGAPVLRRSVGMKR